MKSSAPTNEATRLLVDSIKAAARDLSKAQARQAQLMIQFADARKKADRNRLAELETTGGVVRYEPGEFAAMELGLAVTATKRSVQCEVAMGRWIQSETPDVWDAWIAGDINEAKARKINHTLLRLVRDDSKRLLNLTVVPVAITKTPELLGRWLNAFVAQVEPTELDERIRRSLQDRYVSVRPDLDGVSFLSACLSSLDAASVDQQLDALASIPEPGDPRTKQQRRADTLVDLLLGRISNGWHHTDCGPDPDDADNCGERHDPEHGGHAGVFAGENANATENASATENAEATEDGSATDEGAAADRRSIAADVDDGPATLPPPDSPPGTGAEDEVEDEDGDRAWDEDDWDLPASAFRPDPTDHTTDPQTDETETAPPSQDRSIAESSGSRHSVPAESAAPGRAGPTGGSVSGAGRPTCGCAGHGQPPPRVTIGVVVSAQSLLGLTDTPGVLADRSAHIPAQTIRELAAQPGTLFYRLLTDPTGNLLDVTELGRFPSSKLADAVRFRDGVCGNPGCHLAAHRCDLDHIIPHPEGPTAAKNLDPKCRHDHRAKTHAGFTTTRAGDQTTWTTPTGHHYTTTDEPLPTDTWPDDTG